MQVSLGYYKNHMTEDFSLRSKRCPVSTDVTIQDTQKRMLVREQRNGVGI